MPGKKRKKYLINKSLQLKLIFANIAIMVCVSFLLGAGIYLSIWKSVTEEFSEIKLKNDFEMITRIREYDSVRQRKIIELLPAIREEAKMLSEKQKELLNMIIMKSNRNLIPLIICVIILIFISGLIYTNRLAGPIYRIVANLKEVENGKLSQSFKLRHKDELKELASAVENIVYMFSNSIKIIKGNIEKLKSEKDEEERKKIIHQLEEIINQYDTKK